MTEPTPAVRRRASAPVAAGPLLIAVLPPLALAAIGTAHPQDLNAGDAVVWRNIHFVGLFLFPLLAVPPWLLLRRQFPEAAAVAIVFGYIYAAGYTALDVLAGIGAGNLKVDGFGGQPSLYHPADALGRIGTIAYLAVTVLAIVSLIRLGRPALRVPGAVLVLAGAISFITSHIYPPRGVITMLALAIGWGLLTLASQSPRGSLAPPATGTGP